MRSRADGGRSTVNGGAGCCSHGRGALQARHLQGVVGRRRRPGAQHPNTRSSSTSTPDDADIRYWIQACPLTPAAYKAKVKAGRYTPRRHREAFPSWMLDDVQKTSMTSFGTTNKRVLVYEFYDLKATVIHYHMATILFKGTLDFVPFCIFSLNHSGVDCRLVRGS